MGKASRSKRTHPAPPPPGGAEPGSETATVAPRATRYSPGIPLLVVLVAAALFRVAYFFQYRAGSVFFATPHLDAAIYDAWARRIVGGEWVQADPFYHPPGYPYAVALLYALVGPSVAAVYVVQLVLGLVDIVLIHRLATAAFGRRVGDVAAALAATYAALPFLETKVMSATLALTLLLLALVVLDTARVRGGVWRWALAGVLLGATSLVRTETLLAGPFIVLWILVWGRPARDGWGPTVVAAAVLVAGWAVAIAPAAIHNARAGGGATLISSQGGIAFYQSNNPRARGLLGFLTVEGFTNTPERQAAEEKQIAEKALGRPLTRSEVSGYWFGRGLEFIRDSPGGFLWLLGMKLVRFVDSYEYSTEYLIPVEREGVWLLWLPCVPFGLILALALPSIVRGLRPDGVARRLEGATRLNPTAWLLLLVLASNLLTVLLFYVSSRYRLPSVPPLIVFAAATVVGLAEAWRAGRRTSVALTLALVGAVFLVAQVRKDDAAVHQEANGHFNAANIMKDKEEWAPAAAEYRRAITMDPGRYAFWFNLGTCLRMLGELRPAAEAYTATTRLRPDFFEAYAWQGLLREKTGDLAAARAAYEQAERLQPDDLQVQIGLGRVTSQLGDREAAIRHLDRALAIKPGDEAAREARAKL